MKKLFTLLTMLLIGIGSMWGQQAVTVIDNSTQDATTYGTLSSSTFTTNAASGMAGVTISGISSTTAKTFAYGACLALENTASGTVTMTAPEGYLITGYALTARSNTYQVSYTLTPSAGGSAVTTNTDGVDLSVSGLDNQTASFTYSAGSANSFYIPSLVITVVSATANFVNVTYELYESDGTTLVNSEIKKQVENSAIEVPSSLTAATYYDYTTEGTISSSDCTIKVTRTLKSGYVISLDGLSNSKKYNIQNNRGWWAVDNDASEINSTTALSLGTSTSDTKQQFAFLHYVDDYDNDNNGNVYGGYYLYSVNVGKFAYVDGTKLSLSTLDAFSSPALSKVTFQSSTSSEYKNTAPTVVTLDGKSYGVHTTKTPQVYQYSPYLNDGGNASAIKEAGDFTSTSAMTALVNFLYPTLDNGDTYTFNLYKSDNTTPIYLSPTTSLESIQYIVSENGTNTEGKTVYSLKNASTGKYLSYTNTAKSSGGSDTRLSWADNATNSKFLFSNAYNGRLAIRPAAASSSNYLTAWDIVENKNVIFWTDANANSKNMSYWTVTKVGHAVTYNLKWNGETIKTKSVSSVVTGDESSDYVPWSVPAYCSFTYDVEEIEENTRTVNVTMTWDGPFDISSDFNSAKWYYLKVNEKYAVYGKFKYNNNPITQPYDNEADAKNTIANSMWAFVGNPYDGFEILNRFAGSDKYLDSNSGVAMYMSSSNQFTTFKIGQKEGTVFSMNNGGYYINCRNEYIAANSGVSENASSSLTVEVVPYKFLALAYLPEYAASHHMGEYFGVDESSYNTVKNTVSNLESMTEDEYNQFVSTLNTLLSPKLPETGYYRIKSSGSRGGESYISYGWFSDAKGTGLVTTRNDKMTDCGTVVKLTHVGNGQTYQISIQGLNVQAHTADNTLFTATDAAAVNFAFNHINHSGMCSIFDGTNHGYIHEPDWYNSTTKLNGVVGWGSGNASSWSLEDASTCTVNLNSDGAATPTYYATLCVPFDVTISDATAYILTKSGNYLVPTEVEGNQVPAGTPVLLKGTNSTATATINTGSAFGSPLTCALTGTYVAKTIVGSSDYVLGKKDGKVGFYHWNSNNLAANRAYLAAESVAEGARGFALMFEDDATGIVAPIGETEEETTIYNLSGQRLNKMQKGINIVNGKKVLF